MRASAFTAHCGWILSATLLCEPIAAANNWTADSRPTPYGSGTGLRRDADGQLAIGGAAIGKADKKLLWSRRVKGSKDWAAKTVFVDGEPKVALTLSGGAIVHLHPHDAMRLAEEMLASVEWGDKVKSCRAKLTTSER